jgi:mRNA interferase MazF
MAIVVPGTSTVRSVPLHVVVEPDTDNGLAMTTAFQIEQVRAISVRRLLRRLGHLDSLTLYSIDDVLRNALRL